MRFRPRFARIWWLLLAASACSSSSEGTSFVDSGGAPVSGPDAAPSDAGASVDAVAPLPEAAPVDAGLVPSFDAGWGDAALPAPDLGTVCPTDSFEPNQTPDAKAKKALAVSSAGKVLLGAGVTSSDEDFYDLEPTKKDPIHVTVAYVNAAAQGPLSLEAVDKTGAPLATGVDTVSGANHVVSLSFEVTSVDSVFLHVTSRAADCQPYELLADTAVCTDAYEDNDTASTAVPLRFPSGVQSATVTKGDEDNYQLPSTATRGACVVHYTAPAAGDPALTLNLFDATGARNVAPGVVSGTSTRTLTATWDATGDPTKLPGIVKVQAGNDACTAYTIECSNVTPTP